MNLLSLGVDTAMLVDAFFMTVYVSALSLVAAVILGLVFVIGRRSKRKLISVPTAAYVEFVRNTPLLLQIYVIYFGLPLLGLPLAGVLCGAAAVASQHGAFLCEVFKGGIESVSQMQRESALALGMRNSQAMRKVILPQAVLKVAPAVGNQLIILVKDTSLLAAIGVLELTLVGKIAIERSGATFEVFGVIAVAYLVLTSILGIMLRKFEDRLREKY